MSRTVAQLSWESREEPRSRCWPPPTGGLRDRVSLVLVVAPLNDVSEAIRYITTDVRRDGDALVPVRSGDFFRLVIARSVISCLEPGDDRTALRSHLLALEDYGPEPLSGLRAWPRERLDEPARAAVALLSNEDAGPLRRALRRAAGGASSCRRRVVSDRGRRRDHRAGRARRRPRGQVHPSRRRDLLRRGVPDRAADDSRVAHARRPDRLADRRTRPGTARPRSRAPCSPTS